MGWNGILGFEYGIIQAPLGPDISGPELVSAVANSGAIGLLRAPDWECPEYVREMIRKTRSLTNKPFGIGVVLAFPHEENLKVILEEKVAILQLYWGEVSEELVCRAHDAGVKVVPQVGTIEAAEKAINVGVDAIIVQGREAGGHVIGQEGLISLVPRVVDLIGERDIPAIAAGGIVDARGYVAALALGARGVALGTREELVDIQASILQGNKSQDASCLTNGYLDTPADLPGMKNIRLKDCPSFIRTTNPHDFMLNFMMDAVEETSKASRIILNTFDSFEQEVINFLCSIQDLPPIYTVGPLELLINQITPKDDPIRSIKSNLWKEEKNCMEWLDARNPNSVVFVNFGSITTMSHAQHIEFAWGLANSNKHFLWVIRPDLVKDENAPILPQDFLNETKERGLLVSWCSQREVLKHKAIGGFLTHSGWNSTLETVCGGVPVISWPFFAEQQTNCRYSCVEWGIGMEIGSEVKRDEIEKLVRELMEGMKGKEMKRRIMEWKSKAHEATKVEGSSYKNLVKLIEEVIIVPHN